MEWLYPLLQAVQVISALAVIGLVLLQHGKGADMGSAFGAGSAGSLFGAAGAANFLSRTTRWAAIVFFISTAGLAWAVYHPKQSVQESGSIMSGYESVVPGQSGADAANEPAADAKAELGVPTVPNNMQEDSADEAAAVPTVPASPETENGADGAETANSSAGAPDSDEATAADTQAGDASGDNAATQEQADKADADSAAQEGQE